MQKWIQSFFRATTIHGYFIHKSVKIPCDLSFNSKQISVSGKFMNSIFNISECQDFTKEVIESNPVKLMISWTFQDEVLRFMFENTNDFKDIAKVLNWAEAYVEEPKIKQEISKVYESSEEILYYSLGDLSYNNDLIYKNIFLLIVKSSEYLFSLDLMDYGQIILRIYLTPSFSYMLYPHLKKLDWTQTDNSETKLFSFKIYEDISDLSKILDLSILKLSHMLNNNKDLTSEDLNWLKQELSDQEDLIQSESETEDNLILPSTSPSSSSPIPDITDSSISTTGLATFIASKNMLTIYSNSTQSITSQSSLSFASSSEFVPNHLLPSSSKLLICNKTDPNSIFTFDFTRNKIVSGHPLPCKHPIKELSFPGTEESADFLALSQNSLYRLDPRTVNFIVQNYSYTTDPDFTCFASTSNENLCAGCESGEIKLYSKVGQKAKTRFPGLGNPIKSIKVSEDSQWILATTSQALILLPTVAFGVNGFLASITKKPRKARKLVLAPNDMKKFGIGKVEFSPARFGKKGKEEDLILTTTGRFVVVWDFKLAKKGKVDRYKVLEKSQDVVKGEFIPGSQSAVVTFNGAIEIVRNF